MKNLFFILILAIMATGCASKKYSAENLGCVSNPAELPDPKVVEKIIELKNYDLRWCYTSRNRMSASPEFIAGEMQYNFTLNNLGKVVQSTLETKMVMDEGSIKCMKDVLDRTQFPCSQIKENINLTQKVIFYPHDY